MHRPLLVSVLSLLSLGLVFGAAADRPAVPGRIVAGFAAASAPPGTATLPRFALFGWVSPPIESTTAARYAELAGAGFNLTVLAWEDSGRVADNRARLDDTRATGVRNLLFDRDLEHVDPADSSTFRWADTVATRYRDDPAFLGYYLGDEPPATQFPQLQALFDRLRARDPLHPGWNNLNSRAGFSTRDEWLAYTRQYADLMRPAVLSNDLYDFFLDHDGHQLVENVAGLAAVAREHGIPFWGIVLLVQHGTYRPIDAGLLRWQIAQWLAYGAHGIGYFTYWTPAPDPNYDWQPAMIEWGTGLRTWRYDLVRVLNARLRPLGETLASLQWLATEHAGSVPGGGAAFTPDSLLLAVEGRCALGQFADSLGAPYVFVANSDSLASQALALTFGGVRDVWALDSLGAWHALPTLPASGGVRVGLALAAGDFALLRLSQPLDAAGAGDGALRLAVGPNPARGSVRFELAGARGTVRLELLDAGGRRIWSRRFASAAAVAIWDGRRDDGGAARPGLYFARLEDAGGVRVRRVNWLGAP